MRQAVAANETYSWNNSAFLTALLEVQPTTVLNALFEGNEEDQQEGMDVFVHLDDDQVNPANSISHEALIAWCEWDPERRYPLAASIITFARPSEENGPPVWSEQANALLARAPDPRSVLAVFIERFKPRSWSGSRATAIEANAQLLNSLDPLVAPDLMPFTTEAKGNLAQLVARERQDETKYDQARDERFE